MENENQPVNQTPLTNTTPTVSTPSTSPKSKLPLILAGILLLLLVGGGAYYLGARNNSKNSLNDTANTLPTTNPQNDTTAIPTATPTATTQTAQTNQVAGWNTYTSQAYGFSIQYPKTVAKSQAQWEYKEFPSTDGSIWIGFRPSSLKEDYLWGVNVYDNKTLEEVIKRQGQQFNDRKENRKNIIINGNPALLVTVTTNSIQDWISKTVIVEKNGKIYEISNGAIEIAEFDSFYNSFKTLN